ncbi:MAG: isoleucine--tRNA ligase [Actinomycetota bacterium]|nr:isoleucine--tRNA ligase [Actinomycetota bacterium]
MPFGPVDSQANFVALEERVLARWRASGLAAAVGRHREGGPSWVFYEGPPTANGRPGLHHVWARAFKDLFPRFRTMAGYDVPRKGGWDCHGLPVEIEVEKELGFTRKGQIEEYGIGRFNERCRESVRRYVKDWAALTERSGVWIDTDNAYWTLSDDYVESVWWLVKKLHDDGLLYEGHRVSPYCPRCGTALSSHELGQPGAYRDVTDASAYVRFPLADAEADLVVWTTTPWTLVSNVAAAVGPDLEYVQVADPGGGRDLVLAAARVVDVVGDGPEVRARFTGAELAGRRYRRPFELLDVDGRGLRVVTADFVAIDEGTGIVHLAPAFGADDMDAAREWDLPVVNPVVADGTFDERIIPWVGRPVKETDTEIIADLAARGLLVKEEPYLHAYPHCWRCGTALLYWAKTSWFVRTSERRTDLLEENEKVNWYPDHIKHGRFGDWLENNVDWALSRDRYWGTPLPIWRCGNGHDTCVGSVDELRRLAGRDLDRLDLHRPAVDDVEIACAEPRCSSTGRRLSPVLDAWFDSGSMPSAQHHFPFDADAGDAPATFPADFICEAIDQTRGWFYSLLAVNTLVFGSTPFRNVVCLAHIVDADGQKMSKSKGNVIDPWDVIGAHGADALRWYFFSAGSPWTSRRVYEDGIREAARRTLVTLWNVFAFFATYADIDGWTPGSGEAPPRDHLLDRWISARLGETVGSVTEAMNNFDALGATTTIAEFVDDLSNWYVRRSRPRFWGAAADGASAHSTLHRCLVITAQLLAPFCPFVADELYVSLTGGKSVHLTDWPDVDAALRSEGRSGPALRSEGRSGPALRSEGRSGPAPLPDRAVIEQMAAARRLVGLGRAARSEAKSRVRQPLRRAFLLHPGAELGDEVRQEIADELNVKALEEVTSLAELMTWRVVPNFRALGPRIGPRVNEVKAALAGVDGAEVRGLLETQGWFEVAGERLGPDDVEIRADRHEELALAQDGGWAVALDLELDEALEREGTARELIRGLNDLRKRLDLDLTDRIDLSVAAPGGGRVAAALETHGEWIAAEVLAARLVATDVDAGHDLEVDGEDLVVKLNITG